MDGQAVDLRLPHQPALHAEDPRPVRADLDDFVACYNPENRHERTETERFRAFTYDELVAQDKASLDIFWLRDESLEDTDNLPAPR